MKEIVLNQILPKIEKLINPYVAQVHGDAAQYKYYNIIQSKHEALKNDEERELLTKLVEQANNIRHATTLVNANDDYYSGIYGSFKTAIEYIINNIKVSGFFYTSQLENNLKYEFTIIKGAVEQYQIERQRKQAEAAASASSTRISQIEKSFQELQTKLQNEAAANQALLMKAQWYEQQLALALEDPNYLIGKTPAQFKITTPAHPSQRIASTPSHPSQQLAVNPANARGTLISAVSQKPIDKDREYLNKYFGELPTKILELLSCLSNVNELKDIAMQALQDRILNYKNPASQDLVAKFRPLIKADLPDLQNVEKALQELASLISRDNTGDTHKNVVELLLKTEEQKLLQAAMSKTANVEGCTAQYQIYNRIKQFLIPRPNKDFSWTKELLPDFPQEFIGEINKHMVAAMEFKGVDIEKKKHELLFKLTEQDKKVFKQSAPTNHVTNKK